MSLQLIIFQCSIQLQMDINHIGLSHIAGIISFLITGDRNGYELSCLRKECGKIFTASVLCHFTQRSVLLLVYVKYSSLLGKAL